MQTPSDISEETRDGLIMAGMIAIERPGAVIIAGKDGALRTYETPAWVKFSTEFRKGGWMRRLKGARLSTFLCICLHVNERGEAFPSIPTISEETGYEERTVIRAIQALEEMPGLMQVTRSYGEVNVYAPTMVAYGKATPPPPSIGGGSTPLHGGSKKNQYKKKEDASFHSAPTGGIQMKPLDITAGDEWEGTQDLVVTVPAGSRALRDAYAPRCDMCPASLTQEKDNCPACNRPVRWVNSQIADRRTKRKKALQADAMARTRRDRISNSPAALYVLSLACATSPVGLVAFAKGEEEKIVAYEHAYSTDKIKSVADACKEEGDRSRGLIVHVLRALDAGADPSAKSKSASQDQGDDRLARGAYEAAKAAGMEVGE